MHFAANAAELPKMDLLNQSRLESSGLRVGIIEIKECHLRTDYLNWRGK